MVKVFASLLAADFSRLSSEISRVSSADALHLDVMDGLFVENISFGLPVVKSIRKATGMRFDTHLMIQRPEKYINGFAEAGSNSISFHIEAAAKPKGLLKNIRELGLLAGLAIDSRTPVKKAMPLLPYLDFVLVMSVKAGFGGQAFQENALDKIRLLSREIEEQALSVEIAVDGGINPRTAKKCVACGANILIAGSSIFKAPDAEKAISELKCAAQK